MNASVECKFWLLLGFLLVGGQVGDSVVIPDEGRALSRACLCVFELNKVSVFSAVFAAPQRAIRALV